MYDVQCTWLDADNSPDACTHGHLHPDMHGAYPVNGRRCARRTLAGTGSYAHTHEVIRILTVLSSKAHWMFV